MRVNQWRELIARVNLLKNGRPVVVVGDFNTTKFSPWASEMLPRMQAEGYGDVLDQQYNSNEIAAPRARSLVNAWISSSNRFDRNVRSFSYDTARDTKIGNDIDWVFAGGVVGEAPDVAVEAVEELIHAFTSERARGAAISLLLYCWSSTSPYPRPASAAASPTPGRERWS